MARHATKLTKARLERLRARASTDPTLTVYLADAGQPGLYAWARRGRVRFVFVYRPPARGVRRRMQLDDFGAITLDQARHIAEKLRGIVADGKDPQAERREQARRAVTVAELARQYLEDLRQRAESGARRGRRSGYAAARRYLERNVLPKLGPLRLREVTAEHVRALHRAMKETPVEANRTLTALSAVFGYGDRQGLVPSRFNPCRHVERFEEKGERRALTLIELAALGRAMSEAEADGSAHRSALLALRLLALTGFRRAEVIGHMTKPRRGSREGLRWEDVDLKRGLVHLPATKTGRQTRVIGRAAVKLLKAAKPPAAKPEDPVCPGEVPGQPFVGIDRARRRLYRAAGLDGLPGVDLHSLRHAYASIGAHLQSGRFAAHVGPLLGHGYTKRGITDRYITADPEALRPAADAIADAIAAALGLVERGRVVKFGRRGRAQ